MKLSENNCETCGFNASYINNESDRREDRLCGACFYIIDEAEKSFVRDKKRIKKLLKLLDSREKLLNSKESQ